MNERTLEDMINEVRGQGDKQSQAVYGFTQTDLTGQEVADAIGCSKVWAYKLARKGGVKFRNGRSPVLVAGAAA